MAVETMRALVLHGIGDLRLESVARPGEEGLEPSDVRVRVGFCGVCGSDIPRIFTKGTYTFPTICGHEFAGTVEAVGSGVTSFAPGDRVAVFPLLWCGSCPSCEKGQYVHCSDYDYLGSRCDGGFAELVVAPERNLVPVPDAVSLEEAAMAEPAAVALHALRRGGGTAPGETVVVLGAGPIGLMVAQWARVMGAQRVVVFDIDERKLELARSLGLEEVFDSRSEDPVTTVERLTRGQGAHLTIEAAGVPATTLQALAAVRRGGRVVLLGNPSGAVTLPAELISRLLRREVSIAGTWNSDYSACGNDDDWRTVLAAMGSGTLDLKPLITHRVGLSAAVSTLESMRDRAVFYSKVLVEPGA